MRPSSVETPVLAPRDWDAVRTDFEASAPFNYAVMDSFFDPAYLEDLRSKILAHWGWRYKNWVNQYLHNYELDFPELEETMNSLSTRLPAPLSGMQLVKYWTIMQHRNVGLAPHADNASFIVNVWLTPDDFNDDSATGGLFFFDVKRTDGMAYHEYNTPPYTDEYIAAHTGGERAHVPYAYNRAVLFDARTFHCSDEIRFKNEGAHSSRINLTLAMDDPAEFAARESSGYEDD